METVVIGRMQLIEGAGPAPLQVLRFTDFILFKCIPLYIKELNIYTPSKIPTITATKLSKSPGTLNKLISWVICC